MFNYQSHIKLAVVEDSRGGKEDQKFKFILEFHIKFQTELQETLSGKENEKKKEKEFFLFSFKNEIFWTPYSSAEI